MNFMCYNVENIVKGESKVKKFYYIFLTCLIFLSLAACGSPGANDFSANYSSLPPEEWVWYEEGEYEAGMPQAGFLFPAFANRSTDLEGVNIFAEDGACEKLANMLGL